MASKVEPAGGRLETRQSPVTRAANSRDHYIDLLRAGSLFVVVLWHWVFTVLQWQADGPHASNPIATTPGLWALTWLFQVMPVFFFVGGFAHLRTWKSTSRQGPSHVRSFYERRLKRLLVPALASLAFAAALRVTLALLFPGALWTTNGIVLMLSPLWFLGIYVGLVLIAPLAVRAHEAWGEAVLIALGGGAALVDVLRFHYHLNGVEWVNMLLVWAFAHQLGFFWQRLTAAPRRVAWSLFLAGFLGLLALTSIGLYPRSMVGVAGQHLSNMGPPTVCIVALVLLQMGTVLLLRDRVSAWLARPVPHRLIAWARSRAMTVYLWHFPAFAAAYGLLRLAGIQAPGTATPAWWAQRPLWALAPALCAVPLVTLFQRFEVRAGQGRPQLRQAPAPGRSHERISLETARQ